jgi:hypothetical protein
MNWPAMNCAGDSGKGTPVVEQLAGVLAVAAVFLAYLLVLQCMMAAALLLAQYTVIQGRALRTLIQEPPRPPLPEVQQDQDAAESPPFRVGGGLMRWE